VTSGPPVLQRKEGGRRMGHEFIGVDEVPDGDRAMADRKALT
jgi:hypothetical protein